MGPESFSVDSEGITRALGMPAEELHAGYLRLQRIVALLLAKAGGTVDITVRDDLEVTERRPTVVLWPATFDMTWRLELVDKGGRPWSENDDG